MTSRTARTKDEQGAVIVEFAAIFVVFAMLLWGLISYGVVFAVQQTLSHAAADATRATVGFSDPDAATANAQLILDEQLSWLPESAVDTQVIIDDCPGDQAPECATVIATYRWGERPIVPSILDVATPASISGRAVAQFR